MREKSKLWESLSKKTASVLAFNGTPWRSNKLGLAPKPNNVLEGIVENQLTRNRCRESEVRRSNLHIRYLSPFRWAQWLFALWRETMRGLAPIFDYFHQWHCHESFHWENAPHYHHSLAFCQWKRHRWHSRSSRCSSRCLRARFPTLLPLRGRSWRGFAQKRGESSWKVCRVWRKQLLTEQRSKMSRRRIGGVCNGVCGVAWR